MVFSVFREPKLNPVTSVITSSAKCKCNEIFRPLRCQPGNRKGVKVGMMSRGRWIMARINTFHSLIIIITISMQINDVKVSLTEGGRETVEEEAVIE